MDNPIGYWMYDNAELFRYIGELGCMREGASRILLSGPFSAFLASVCRKLYPDAGIVAVTDRADVLDAASKEDGKLEESVYDALSNECPIQRKGRFLRWEELLSGRT